MKYRFFALILLIADIASASVRFGLNDVSILLPLPKSELERSQYALNANTAIQNGQLVSFDLLKRFDISQVSALDDFHKESVYESFTVVGIRFDPCFQDKFTDVCQPQVRFVLQPYEENPVGNRGLDSAIHLFFEVSNERLLEIIHKVRDLRATIESDSNYTNKPLTVHPIVASQGLSGVYFSQLKGLLTSSLSPSQLKRVAVFMSGTGDEEWLFRSFDIRNNQISNVEIPDFQPKTHQVLEARASGLVEFLTPTIPLPKQKSGTDQFFDFLSDSVKFKREASEAQMSRLSDSLVKVENPGSHLPGTIDCISCHTTASVMNNLTKTTPWGRSKSLFVSKTLPPEAFVNSTQAGFDTLTFRLFGYRDFDPAIGQRVFNESAAIVDQLNSSL